MNGVRHFLLALQFFTRVPVTGPLAGWVGFSPAMLRASDILTLHVPFTPETRSMIGARSSPVGSVPNAPPHWPPSRLARNASATAGCPCRTSRDPCSANEMSSAT